MRTLNGLKVLVTRPEHQALGFCTQLQARQAQALALPVLRIEPTPPSQDQIEHWTKHNTAGQSSLAIFTSANAVTLAAEALEPHWPAKMPLAAVGQRTAEVLAQHSGQDVIYPTARYNSEALLETLAPLLAKQSRQIVLFTGEQGRDLLQNTLQRWGHKVRRITVYRRAIVWEQASQLQALCLNAEPDIVSITSDAGLQSLLALADTPSAEYLKRLPLIVNSERCKALARRLGFQREILVANPSGDLGQITALEQWHHHSQR